MSTANADEHLMITIREVSRTLEKIVHFGFGMVALLEASLKDSMTRGDKQDVYVIIAEQDEDSNLLSSEYLQITIQIE